MNTENRNIIADKLIDEAFKAPPSVSLPDNFTELVAAKAVRRFAWRQYFQEFMVYLYAFLGLIVVTVTIAFLWLGADWQVWKQILVNHSAMIISVNVLALFVLFADKVLLQYFMYKSSGMYRLY